MIILSPRLPTLMMFPYGICVNKLMVAAMEESVEAATPYNPALSVEERAVIVKKRLVQLEGEMTKQKKSGFWIADHRKYGSTARHRISYNQLSTDALFYITNFWTSPELAPIMPYDRKIKETIKPFLTSHYHHFLDLYSKRDHDYTDGSAKQLFLKAVIKEHSDFTNRPDQIDSYQKAVFRNTLTPLGLYPYYALNVDPTPTGIPGYRQYSRLRQSNIAGLFMANGFLTYLDRRHYDTEWDFSDHLTEEDLADLENSDIMTLPEFTTYTLRNYYRKVPSAYSLINPTMTREEWDQSPEYYMITETPAFRNTYEDEGEKIVESQCPIKYTCSGVAVGRENKYIIHHTRRGNTPWYPHVEKSAIRAIQSSLVTMGLAKTAREAQVEHCIVVTETQRQFSSFFYTVQEKRHNREMQLLSDPYISLNIVTLDHSGIEQIKHLMLYGPETYKQILESKLIQADEEYCSKNSLGEGRIRYEGNNSVFRLVYQEDNTGRMIPVFVGHPMDLEEIGYVYDAYLNGLDFLISCYPQQISYYRHIMPDARFL